MLCVSLIYLNQSHLLSVNVLIFFVFRFTSKWKRESKLTRLLFTGNNNLSTNKTTNNRLIKEVKAFKLFYSLHRLSFGFSRTKCNSSIFPALKFDIICTVFMSVFLSLLDKWYQTAYIRLQLVGFDQDKYFIGRMPVWAIVLLATVIGSLGNDTGYNSSHHNSFHTNTPKLTERRKKQRTVCTKIYNFCVHSENRTPLNYRHTEQRRRLDAKNGKTDKLGKCAASTTV